MVGLTIGVVLTLPDIAVVPLLLILGVGAIVLPVVVYPVSYTVWQAVDLAMRPPEPGDDVPRRTLTPLPSAMVLDEPLFVGYTRVIRRRGGPLDTAISL